MLQTRENRVSFCEHPFAERTDKEGLRMYWSLFFLRYSFYASFSGIGSISKHLLQCLIKILQLNGKLCDTSQYHYFSLMSHDSDILFIT